jgi:hypothetical protein
MKYEYEIAKRKWFRCSDSRLIDLEKFNTFYFENVDKKFVVFGVLDTMMCLNLKEFQTFDEAKDFLDCIHSNIEYQSVSSMLMDKD